MTAEINRKRFVLKDYWAWAESSNGMVKSKEPRIPKTNEQEIYKKAVGISNNTVQNTNSKVKATVNDGRCQKLYSYLRSRGKEGVLLEEISKKDDSASLKSLQRDIQKLVDDDIPICGRVNGRKITYFIDDDDPQRLTVAEFNRWLEFQKICLDEYERLIKELEDSGKISLQDAKFLSTQIPLPILSIEQLLNERDCARAIVYYDNAFNPNKRSEKIKKEQLFDIISARFVINLKYKNFDEKIKIQEFHPWALKEYNQRWFLIGFNKEKERIEARGLERIIEFSVLKDTPLIEPETSLCSPDMESGLLDNIIGVSGIDEVYKLYASGKYPPEIKIRMVNLDRWPYIKTKPIHHSQSFELFKDGDALYFTISVYPNKELFQRLLSFGSDISVLEPLCVREEMQRLTQLAADNYK